MYDLSSQSSSNTSSTANAALKFIKVLGSSRFPVLLVEDSIVSQNFVLKIFPLEEGGLSKSFLHESNMLTLVHSNIITVHSAMPRYSFAAAGTDGGDDASASSISAILMEHAVNGDLCRLLKMASKNLSEAAVRTLFLQLLDGLEFLHGRGYVHLDLKPDNLLLGQDFTLKIGDFDQVTPIQNGFTSSKGTPGYRAPEVKGQSCGNLPAADIFSAGVILFVMKSRVPPFLEGKLSSRTPINLYDELVKEDNAGFWKLHSKHQNNTQFFSESFKSLIVQMLQLNPEKRPTISEIRKSEWCNGPVLDQNSLREELSRL